MRIIYGSPQTDAIDQDIRTDTMRHHIREMKALRHQIKKIEDCPPHRRTARIVEVHADLRAMYRYHDSASRTLLTHPNAIWVLR